MNSDYGIYILADDGVIEWLSALLSSIRLYSPNIRIFIIPFSHRIDRLNHLSHKFRFSVIEDASLCQLDQLGISLIDKRDWPMGPIFRKFAAFWGPLRYFLLLDSDVLLLDDPVKILTIFASSGLDLIYAHSDHNWVYKAGSPLQNKMLKLFNSQGINAGVWASRRGLLTLSELQRLSLLAQDDKAEFVALEQSFLNYCLDLKEAKMQPFWKVSNGDVNWIWPGENVRLSLTRKSLIPFVTAYCNTEPEVKPQRVSGIHWAGYRLNESMPHYDLWLFYRSYPQGLLENIKILLARLIGKIKFLLARLQ